MIPPLVLRIYADSTGLKAGLSKSVAQTKAATTAMTSQYNGFGKRVTQTTTTAAASTNKFSEGLKANAGLIKLAAAAAIIGIGVKSVKAFNESEAAIAQTNAVLTSTKGIAGVTAGEVTKLATALQKVTTFSDEEVRSAENLLLTFTNISDDIFPDTTRAVLDMSQALGQDLKSSSIQLGKALNDPILGLTSLSRVGVKFTQETRDQIKAMVEAGNVMGAQKLILKELSTEFGGSAKKAAGTFSGQMKQLGNQLNDVLEEFGKLITTIGPVLIPVIEFAIKALRKMVVNLGIMVNAVKVAAIWVGDKFVAAWQAVRGPVLAVIHAITWAVEGLISIVQAAVDALQFLAELGSQATYSRPASSGVGKFGMGAKAAGGPVSAWKPYLVGEQGPELFVPRTGGTVIPNDKLGGGVTVNVYGDVNDAERFTRKVVTAIERAAARM